VTQDNFIEGFGRDVADLTLTVQCSIEDIIKPLMTKIKKFNVNISDLFDKYDKNKNKRLSPQELATALGNDMRINLTEEEIQAIKDYFKNKHNTTEIGELDFITMMNTKFSR
jgi:Ca2+-binding EF-hand superfamily protein